MTVSVAYEVHGERVANLTIRPMGPIGSPTRVSDLRKEVRSENDENSNRWVPKEYTAFRDGEPLLNNDLINTGDVIRFYPVTITQSVGAPDVDVVENLLVRVAALEKRNTELEATIQRLLKDDTVALRKEL